MLKKVLFVFLWMLYRIHKISWLIINARLDRHINDQQCECVCANVHASPFLWNTALRKSWACLSSRLIRDCSCLRSSHSDSTWLSPPFSTPCSWICKHTRKTNGCIRACPARQKTNKPLTLSHQSLWSCTISSFWCHPQFCSALSHLRINCSCSPARQLNHWDFTCELLRIHLEQFQTKITFSQAQYDRTN